MPTPATRKPEVISRRGWTRNISRPLIWVEPMIMQAIKGRNARPATTRLYPLTIWK